ncbi:hypothetical protein CJU90_0746 [Yarrowia sp. C11]|nr:hypothetical protein CKK34_2159 [Yarrowia sp. E02]KAG5373078.1 hypothetical protein CJU90_0746 [Yarrowia sp. C11]
MITIHNNATYTTNGKTHPISRQAMFNHLVRKQAMAHVPSGPPSFRDIPNNLTDAQRRDWEGREHAKPLCIQQQKLLKEFTQQCGPMVCEHLLKHGRYKQLQTSILEYTTDEWLDAVYQTLSTIIPWWFFDKLYLFTLTPGAQMHALRVMWLTTCIGLRERHQEQSHLDLIANTDLVEVASEIDSSPPIVPTDRTTRAFVESLLDVLEYVVPNGYLHTMFQPNTVRLIFETFGFTSCLDLKLFFAAFRYRESDLLRWIRQDKQILCPRERINQLPRNMLPHDVATTFNGLTATFMRQNPFVHDRDMSLPQCLEKYGVLNDYYTELQLETLHNYVKLTSDYILHSLHEYQVEEAVEMMLQDLSCHPHLTFSLKAMKSANVYSLSHLTRVAMAQLRYVEIRLEFLRSNTTDGEYVTSPDLSCAFVVPNSDDAIEIDSEHEHSGPSHYAPPILIRHDAIGYENNTASHSHEIAKRNAYKWITASTNPVVEYLQTFEMLRDTKLCKNCIFSRRYRYNVKTIAHDTAKCTYPNLWETMKASGLRSVDFDLVPSKSLTKQSLHQMDQIRRQWIEASEEKREAFDDIASQMPHDSCRNCLFRNRSAKGGFAIMHKTKDCRNTNLYQRLFDKEMYPWEKP